MVICKSKTKKGTQCKRQCKKGRKYCYQHIKKGGTAGKITGQTCNLKFQKYKDVCNKVWEGNCGYNYSLGENSDWNKDVKLCAKRRIEYMNDCVPVDNWDEPHVGAIAKMIKKKDYCNHIITEQKISKTSSDKLPHRISLKNTSQSLTPTSTIKRLRPKPSERFSRNNLKGGKKKKKKKN